MAAHPVPVNVCKLCSLFVMFFLPQLVECVKELKDSLEYMLVSSHRVSHTPSHMTAQSPTLIVT